MRSFFVFFTLKRAWAPPFVRWLHCIFHCIVPRPDNGQWGPSVLVLFPNAELPAKARVFTTSQSGKRQAIAQKKPEPATGDPIVRPAPARASHCLSLPKCQKAKNAWMWGPSSRPLTADIHGPPTRSHTKLTKLTRTYCVGIPCPTNLATFLSLQKIIITIIIPPHKILEAGFSHCVAILHTNLSSLLFLKQHIHTSLIDARSRWTCLWAYCLGQTFAISSYFFLAFFHVTVWGRVKTIDLSEMKRSEVEYEWKWKWEWKIIIILPQLPVNFRSGARLLEGERSIDRAREWKNIFHINTHLRFISSFNLNFLLLL